MEGHGLNERESGSVPDSVYSALKLIVFNERACQLSMEASMSNYSSFH